MQLIVNRRAEDDIQKIDRNNRLSDFFELHRRKKFSERLIIVKASIETRATIE